MNKVTEQHEKLITLVDTLVDTFVTSHGGARNPFPHWTKWDMPSRAGLFHVSIHKPSRWLAVFGQFEDVLRAAVLLKAYGLNPFSGEYNYHSGSVYRGATAESTFLHWTYSMKEVTL